MGKFADKYFKTDPWQIVEEGFDPQYAEVAESIFSLGNEYTGLRGYFEEGYSGQSLQGSYINGIYERREVEKSGYKGMLPFAEFMVNTVDWQYVRITCNGVALDLAKITPKNFVRALDMRTGVLRRSFEWQVDAETLVSFTFERFLSMPSPELGGQRITIQALSGCADVQLDAGLDFSRLHMSTGENYWRCSGQKVVGNGCEITGDTVNTGQTVHAAARFEGLQGQPFAAGEQIVGLRFAFGLSAGQQQTLTRIASITSCKNEGERQAFQKASSTALQTLAAANYDELKAESAVWWQNQWAVSDIEIEGDGENQQGIRYCIFQLNQTLHTAGHSAVIGAKGLTGEAYNGNSFWDTEVYCLPFYLFNNPAAAKNILQFRHDTLPEAKERAVVLDNAGAFYPIATISGRECCDLWQHANLQLQASTSVAYGLWNYVHVTKDEAFLFEKGAEILVEISRMLAQRGAFNSQTGAYGYYGVMGPDEFHMMVNNNCYTNYMGQKVFRFALQTLKDMKQKAPGQYAALTAATALREEELADWKDKADRMFIPYDETTFLFEQHDGFYSLPHIDVKSIPVEDFPLYTHWAYDRIYRYDMLKQPDVLMFMLMYLSEFSDEQLAANFDYYEPRCIHESSLSPSVHSILAAQLGRMGQAYEFFQFATRMDLDNYNRNTREGLHTTSIAGSWMNIVYGFGGLRSDGDLLALSPAMPAQWQGYSFRLQSAGCVLHVKVSGAHVSVRAEGETPPQILLYGKPVQLSATEVVAEIPLQWRASA